MATFRLALAFFFMAASALAQEGDTYRDFTPDELLILSLEERQSSVPIMFTNAANLAVSPLGDSVIGAMLSTLMYDGFADYDLAVRAFQSDLGEEVTGELTVWQIHQLGYRAARTRLGYVSFFPFGAGGSIREDFASVTGTATILGDQIAYPVNYVTIECLRQDMTCRYRQVALLIPDENSWTQSYGVSEIADQWFRVTRWEDEQIDATPFDNSTCRITQLSFNFRSEEYYEVARNNSEGDCELGFVTLPRLEQPRITQIVDGYDVIAETFQEIQDEAASYYSSAFRERIADAIAASEAANDE